MTLKEARKFLGKDLFNKALFKWSLIELVETMDHPECLFSGADVAYGIVLNYRLKIERE